MVSCVALASLVIGRTRAPREAKGAPAETHIPTSPGPRNDERPVEARDPPQPASGMVVSPSPPAPTSPFPGESTRPRQTSTAARGDAARIRHAVDLADEALEQGDVPRARQMARECLGLDPGQMECHNDLIMSFTRSGEYGPELRQALDDCLSTQPRDPFCLEAKVLSQVQTGDIGGARDTLAIRESLTDQPPDYIGEAEIALASHQTAAACEAFRNACRLTQEFACAMAGTICSDAGDGGLRAP